MRSSRIGAFGSHSVSPVVASLRPAAATISPATAFSSRSRFAAWIAEQARDLFLLVRADVQHLVARLEHAAEDPHEHDLAAFVHRDLERERRERLGVLRLALELLGRVARIDAGHRRQVRGRRQVVDHRVEQRVDALVAQRGAVQHRHHLHRDRRLADRGLDLGDRELCALEVLLGDRIVEIRDRLDHLIARIGGRRGDVLGDRR